VLSKLRIDIERSSIGRPARLPKQAAQPLISHRAQRAGPEPPWRAWQRLLAGQNESLSDAQIHRNQRRCAAKLRGTRVPSRRGGAEGEVHFSLCFRSAKGI